MKRLIYLLILTLALSCKKSDRVVYTAVVAQNAGCTPSAYLVRLTSIKLPLDCGGSSSTYCKDQAFVLNLPANLQVIGKSFSFTRFTDHGVFCLSSSVTAHHIDVADAVEIH